MKAKSSFGALVGAAVLFSAFSAQVSAGSTEGLSACKAQIADDSQMSGYSRVDANMQKMKRRGRYNNFKIKVKGQAADGSSEIWTAECKTRSSGRVEELQLTRVNADSEQSVAQTGS
jgi:hypothetical protein